MSGDLIWSPKSDVESTNENDELIAWRGSGRYFGNPNEADDSDPLCRICGEKGHIAVDCKSIFCELCGEKNLHTTRSCPANQRCSKCGDIGHVRSACKGQARTISCNHCNARTHTELTCTYIWRQYVFANGNRLRYPIDIACYNCASIWHFGDDCPRERPIDLKYRETSAFSHENMATKFRAKYEKDKERVRRDYERRYARKGAN